MRIASSLQARMRGLKYKAGKAARRTTNVIPRSRSRGSSPYLEIMRRNALKRRLIAPEDFATHVEAREDIGREFLKGDGPIVSLVSDDPGLYYDRVRKGQEAFLAGQYTKGLNAFRVATSIAKQAPQGRLGLIHTHFALGHYRLAAYHLREALKYFPELPTKDLRIRRFFASDEVFAKHLEQLREEYRRPDADAEISLLWAYFRYFDGSEADAAKALRRSLAVSDDSETSQAVRAFWAGMVAVGKASGALDGPVSPTISADPSTPNRPQPATRPPRISAAGTSGNADQARPPTSK